MNGTLPERRLLVRAGPALLTLDLTQIREVKGQAGGDALLLAQALELPLTSPGLVLLLLETQTRPVPVLVDAVGGVVEVAKKDVLKVSNNVLLRRPSLVRAVMRVPEPSQWRGTSMLPTPVMDVAQPTPSGNRALAVDLDPVELGNLLCSVEEAA